MFHIFFVKKKLAYHFFLLNISNLFMQHSKDLSKPQSRESDGNYLIILLKI